MPAMTPTPVVDLTLAGEAADWLIRLDQGTLGHEEERAFERWRNSSPAHTAAWGRAEALMRSIDVIPKAARGNAMRGLAGNDRRRALKLAVMLAVAPAAWLAWRNMPWEEWNADLRTATGEQQRITLPDGSELVLNTGSAVKLAFSATERRVHLLAGEILVSTGQDPAPHYRPFIVETAQGTVRALGTRFTVRLQSGHTRAGVLAHAVELRPVHGSQVVRLEAGQAALFDANGLVGGVQVQDPAAVLWEKGLFVAQKLPLAELLSELGRYRKGMLRCHPQVAQMVVSGAFSVTDTDASLRLLTRTLPLRLQSLTRYWVSVEPV
jgi:transmembrane sensor